jgi:sialate O-acetylesterase
MNFKLKLALIPFSLLSLISYTHAQIRLPNIIGSNMVLQRNQVVPVWGWTAPGKTVKVRFSGQEKSAAADDKGYFKINLSPLKTSDKPQDMVISSDTSTIHLVNILVGEVWLCSGQSNMEYTMKLTNAKPVRGIDSAALELSAHNPQIRLFKVEKKLSLPDVTTTGWSESEGDALAAFSAPGYYFAKNIYEKLHVPIGVITSAWGGSRIEPWTPAAAYEGLPAFKEAFAKQPLLIDSVVAGKNYESMIAPLAPFAIHGFLWYQGESNCMTNEGIRYADKMQALVDSWRKEWGNDELPFYSVLIAPYYYTKRKDHVRHTAETLPEFWEAQTESLKIPNTDIITVTDLVDHLSDIHPSYKWEVGRRLALLALAKDYGYTSVAYSGPRYQKMQVKNDKIILSFTHAGGLKTNNGKPLDNFMIAGEDNKFVPATAEIAGDQVIVSSAAVAKPAAIRFAWDETAMPNLVNATGIPALPFRTNGKKWVYVKAESKKDM